jgi:hypothetical protein
MPMPRTIKIQDIAVGAASPSVVRIAIAIPTMPNVLPRRDVAGLDKPLSARMKSTPAAR